MLTDSNLSRDSTCGVYTGISSQPICFLGNCQCSTNPDRLTTSLLPKTPLVDYNELLGLSVPTVLPLRLPLMLCTSPIMCSGPSPCIGTHLRPGKWRYCGTAYAHHPSSSTFVERCRATAFDCWQLSNESLHVIQLALPLAPIFAEVRLEYRP
ncbi:uncharacterized protein M421DRAFT_309828 [Didymella exigua CBS 183.55]|uniref:Uncharacterized protein n=1 Tax=Didymella exigua CBS 183.55 TaxID=1150837 RepID=A0A6A5R658_9PLEO|nr:uncharacterized protein M421DRAFT_309828 [Didymella exigua CBS 183.55]KAF1923605.1 hypothetical protein M421DRAFT_309828 [Didymella exigua CBS 183.55]